MWFCHIVRCDVSALLDIDYAASLSDNVHFGHGVFYKHRV